MVTNRQIADIKQHNSLLFTGYVRQILELADSATTNEYALKSFLSYIGNRNLTRETLTGWVASLFLAGKKAATVKRYLCRLHVVYLDWMTDSETTEDPFKGVLHMAVKENQVDLDALQSSLGIIRKSISTRVYVGDEGKWRAIFFWLLYSPNTTLEDIANLKFESAGKACPQIAEIIESMNSSHGRKYIFDLGQADKRITGMVRDIKENLRRISGPFGLKISGDNIREGLSALWILASLKAGITVEEIKAMMPLVPKDFQILDYVTPAEISAARRNEILCRVADAINDTTTRWYVLNMRDKITPDNVKEFIFGEFPDLFEHMQFFYPTHYIYRESRRKKLVKQEVPFLPGLLFVKVRSDMVGLIMRKITKLAWGYKYANTPDSPYSVIPQKSMMDFQRHIGVFSEDIKVELIENNKPMAQGQIVRVLRSDFYGMLGEIQSVKNNDNTVYYTIQLTDDTAVKITLENLDAMMLERIS